MRSDSTSFGLNLDEMQIIEVPIISGNSKITENAINHLFGIALHEICHFFYHKSRFFQNLLCAKEIEDKNIRKIVMIQGKLHGAILIANSYD